MKPKAHKLVPGLIMAAASAVPMVTTAGILAHVTSGENNSVVAVAPAPTPAPSPTSKPSSQQATKAAAPTVKPTATPTTRTIAGRVVNEQFGGVQATITVKGTKITNVAISAPQDNPHSAAVNTQAVPLLQSETLQAQSANVNTISGATLTSEAYIQSLQSALKSAQIA
jgi:uncharacterized protein with FMN-binding domain